MDLEHLNRIAQQVTVKVQQQTQAQSIQFAVWQRGFTDPDTYTATGRIFRKGQRSHNFSLPHLQLLDLFSQTDDQASQTLEALLTHEISQELR